MDGARKSILVITIQFVLLTSSITYTTQTSFQRGDLVTTCGVAKERFERFESKIVQGGKAEADEWPWMVALRQDMQSRNSYCGGTLISDRHVITAAHCVDFDPNEHPLKDMKLIMGQIEFDRTAMPSRVYGVESVHIHDDFNAPIFKNDIAILKTDRRVETSKSVRQICLPTKSKTFAHELATVIGFGAVFQEGPTSNSLLKLNLRVLDNAECAKKYAGVRDKEHKGVVNHRFQILETMICAGGEDGNDACQGDSGGPLNCFNNVTKRWELCGIVSGGIGCGKQGIPGVYTRVTEYLDWIVKMIGSSPLESAPNRGVNDEKEITAFLKKNGLVDVSSKNSAGQTALFLASETGNEPVVKKLLENHLDQLNVGDDVNDTPLHVACQNKHSNIVIILLQHEGIIVDPMENEYRNTPLIDCSQHGEIEGVKALLRKGADIEHKTSTGSSALNGAIGFGEMSVALILIAEGANVNVVDTNNDNAFTYACFKIFSSVMVKTLIDKGADFKKRNQFGMDGFSIACANNNTEVVKFMLENGYGDVSTMDDDGRTPLSNAADNGHDQVVKLLLEHGLSELNVGDHNGTTPLHQACRAKDSNTVKILLQYKEIIVDPLEKVYERTPLIECSQNGEIEGIKALLRKGADIELKSSNGNTPLMEAIGFGEISAAFVLIAEGASINAVNAKNETAFHYACYFIFSSLMAKTLIDKGADFQQKRDDGMDGFNIACWRNNTEVAEFLLDNGYGDVSTVDVAGWTPLLNAAEGGHDEIVKMLLENGVQQLNQAGDNGYTPLHAAAEKGHDSVVALLLEYNASTVLKNKDGYTAEELAVKNNFWKIATEISSKTVVFWKNQGLN